MKGGWMAVVGRWQANRLASPETRQRTGEVSLLRRLRLVAPVQAELGLWIDEEKGTTCWVSMPERVQVEVLGLLAGLIARGVLSERVEGEGVGGG